MDLSNITEYSFQSAGAFLLAVVAYKILKMRSVTESSCCGEHFKMKAISRGGSSTDVELTPPVAVEMGDIV